MALVHSHSLCDTVNAVNDAFLHGKGIAPGERRRTASWIAGRQGLPGAYAGTFALFSDELRDGIRLLTGERTRSAAARHIAGEEACRALRLLDVPDASVKRALDSASASLAARVGPIAPPTGSGHRFDAYRGGVFCCGRCSVGVWRHIVAGGFDDHERRLQIGLEYLASMRSDDHSWSTFPFWYTVSALIEMPTDLARPHLQHAASRLARAADRTPGDELFARRRHAIARRAMTLL